MIASISGPALASGAGWVTISVGGIGFRVEVPSGRHPQAHPGDEVFLHTSLVVREDSLTLFGFASEDELEVFTQLISVSGVGPRSALGVLSALSPSQIVAAVSAEDEKPFRRVSGIGPKTAKLMLVQLAGKLAGLALSDEAPAVSVEPEVKLSEDVRDGLIGLGWSESDAWQAVLDAQAAGAPNESSALLRAALALLQAARSGGRGGAR